MIAVTDRGSFGRAPGALAVPKSWKGELDIHGKPRLAVWTKVEPPGITEGARAFSTVTPVDFQAGEVLVLTVPVEVVTVLNVSADGLLVTVTKPLKGHTSTLYTHSERGSGDGASSRVVDMRCEVALMSRNVVIQGDETSDADLFGCHTGAFHGGHYRYGSMRCCVLLFYGPLSAIIILAVRPPLEDW